MRKQTSMFQVIDMNEYQRPLAFARLTSNLGKTFKGIRRARKGQ